MALTKHKISIIALLTIGVLAFASLPLSNFFLKRKAIEVTGGVPEFKPVSKLMQNKCVDCHTPGMISEPIYAKLPGASQLIKSDMEEAQQQIIFSKDHLSGEKPFSKLEMARIQTVVENNEMPILPYKIMHWDAGLSSTDKAQVLAWIQAQAQTKNHDQTKTIENVQQ